MLGTIITKERILSSSSFPFNIENNPKMQVHRTDEKIEKVGSEAVHEQHFQNLLCVKKHRILSNRKISFCYESPVRVLHCSLQSEQCTLGNHGIGLHEIVGKQLVVSPQNAVSPDL